MDWEVRRAKLEDYWQVVMLSRYYSDVLMPYTCSNLTTKGYLSQFLLAEKPEDMNRIAGQPPHLETSVGGAVHFVPNEDSATPLTDKVASFLTYIKQVPTDIIVDFMSQREGYNIAMIGQVICPGKGSFYAILEEAKKQYEEIWCWMSISGPSYKSYQRYGFVLNMEDVREFWNVYKCGYSKFVLGKWKKDS